MKSAKPQPKPKPQPNLRSKGISLRKQHPRTSLAECDLARRKEDPRKLLDRSMRGRIPALFKLKTERMCASPFGFFRGAVPVMAYDLSLLPNSSIVTQLCGDAHVQNLGAFCGLDGALIFDINDFDETIRGPFDWDVKRMATSILLAGTSADIAAFGCLEAVETFLEEYCDLMQRFSRMPILAVARYQVHRLNSVAPISKILRKAERETPLHSVERLTVETPKGRVFKSNLPILRPLHGAEAASVIASLPAYARTLLPERQRFFAKFRPIAVAFKVVGTGSVGLRDYCVLLEGNGASDPLFLQIKEEAPSAYAHYLPKSAVTATNDGQRAVEGQRAMQLQSDPLLGWTSIAGRGYLVRQLNDHKASVDIATLKASGLAAYASVCGEMLARGHARSGDARIIAGYIGSGKRFKQAITTFATAYARQSIADWKTLVATQKKPETKKH